MGKKPKNCDPTNPDDDPCGDSWDHVAFAPDPEHKLVLAVIPGARSAENAEAIVAELKERLGGQPPDLMTSDESPAYEPAIGNRFGEPASPGRKPGRPRVVPERRVPGGLVYATVPKPRENSRVVAVEQRQVFKSGDELEGALGESRTNYVVNTSFVERQDATERGSNARKARKPDRFRKDCEVHEAMTYRTLYSDNFCWCVRTLRVKDEDGRWRERSPALAVGLTDHVWTWREWFGRPAVQST